MTTELMAMPRVREGATIPAGFSYKLLHLRSGNQYRIVYCKCGWLNWRGLATPIPKGDSDGIGRLAAYNQYELLVFQPWEDWYARSSAEAV